MRAELRDRTLGEMLGLTFSLAADRFGALFIILLLGNIPQVIVQMVLLPDPSRMQMGASPTDIFAFYDEFLGSVGWWMAAAFLPYPFVQAAAALVAAQSFKGEERSLGWILKEALRRYGRMFLLLVALGMFNVIGICPGAFIGFLLFSAWFYVAVPIVVLEDVGWAEALQRSRALGHRHYSVTLVMFLATQYGVFFALAPFAFIFQMVLQDYYYANVLVQSFLALVVGVIPLVAPVVTYFHLRVIKEHYDVQRLAELVPVIGERNTGPQ